MALNRYSKNNTLTTYITKINSTALAIITAKRQHRIIVTKAGFCSIYLALPNGKSTGKTAPTIQYFLEMRGLYIIYSKNYERVISAFYHLVAQGSS